MTRFTSVGSERKGYGRGLILGLTMAETMLLLVFCLLLAVGAIIAGKEKEAQEARDAALLAEDDLAKAKTELSSLTELVEDYKERIASIGSSAMPDEDWRELRLAREIRAKIEAVGLTLEEAADNALLTKAAVASELVPETVAEMVRAAKAVSSSGIQPEEMIELARAVEVLKAHDFLSDDRISELDRILAAAASSDGSSKPHEWPPIINLSETRGQSFASGSAELTDGFKERLAQVAPRIAQNIQRYDVNIVEVIGHTDEQAMSGNGSNMDRGMKTVLDGSRPIGTLTPADNAGLGLARALSVVNFLRTLPELESIDAVTFIPMSGGQLVLPGDLVTDGTKAGDDPARRRIEIRVRERLDTDIDELKKLAD